MPEPDAGQLGGAKYEKILDSIKYCCHNSGKIVVKDSQPMTIQQRLSWFFVALGLFLVLEPAAQAQLGQSDWQSPGSAGVSPSSQGQAAAAPSNWQQPSGQLGQSDWQQPSSGRTGQSNWQPPSGQLGQSDWQQPSSGRTGQSNWQQPNGQLGQSDWQQPGSGGTGQSSWQQPGGQVGQSNWQQPGSAGIGQSNWQQPNSAAPPFKQNYPLTPSNKPILLGEVLEQEQTDPSANPMMNAANIAPPSPDPTAAMNSGTYYPPPTQQDPMAALGTLMGSNPQAQAQMQAMTTLAPAVLNFMSSVMPPGGMRGGIGGFPAPGTGYAGGVGQRGYSSGYGTGYGIGANTVQRAANQAAAGLNSGLMRMMSNIGR